MVQYQLCPKLFAAGRSLLCLALLLVSTLGWANSESMTSKTYNRLTDIQALLAEDRTDEAHRELMALHENVDANTTDEAMVLQMLGYTEMSRENYDQAIEYMRASLELDKLPEQMKYELGYMVAQLYAAQEEYDQAITFAEGWFETLEEPKPQQLMFMANLLAQTERYERALPYAEQAVAASDSPRESWYQLLISSSFNLEAYDKTERYLRAAISGWPDDARYWEQLASVYLIQKREDKALATLQLAWRNGVLEKESAIRSMIQLAISGGIPDRAGRLLETAMERNLVPTDERFLKLRVNAWRSAREYDKAIGALEALAAETGSGNAYITIANIHLDRAQWQPAINALQRARQLEVDEPGRVWLLLGIAYTEQEQFQDGMEAFRKARAFGYTEGQAKNWLKYAEGLRRQHNWKSRHGDA